MNRKPNSVLKGRLAKDVVELAATASSTASAAEANPTEFDLGETDPSPSMVHSTSMISKGIIETMEPIETKEAMD